MARPGRAWMAAEVGWRSVMNDEPEHTDVFISGAAVVEIDAEKIAQIIFDTCHTSEQRAARAANLILDYLAEAHQRATRAS
jgi:hypothetical protein